MNEQAKTTADALRVTEQELSLIIAERGYHGTALAREHNGSAGLVFDLALDLSHARTLLGILADSVDKHVRHSESYNSELHAIMVAVGQVVSRPVRS